MVSSKRMIISWHYVWFYTFFLSVTDKTFQIFYCIGLSVRYLASGLISTIQRQHSPLKSHNKIWTDILPLPHLHCVLLRHPPYQISNISIGIKGNRVGCIWHLASFPLPIQCQHSPLKQKIDRYSSTSLFALRAPEASYLSNSKYQRWHRGKQGWRYLASGLISAIQHQHSPLKSNQ